MPVWLVQRILSVQVGLDKEKILFVTQRLEFSRRKLPSAPLLRLIGKALSFTVLQNMVGRKREDGGAYFPS